MSETALVEEHRFETSQTVVAVYFYYSGLEIVEMIWSHGKCTFYFENTDELQTLLTQYIMGKARVEPQGFNNAYGDVKSRMFKVRDATPEEER